MTESKRTAALRDKLKGRVFTFKLNARYANGVPDCYYSGAAGDLWNEHKYIRPLPPIIDLTKPSVTSKLQQRWLIGRHKEGRNVAMVVFSDDGHLLLTGLDWQRPITRDEFRELAVPMQELADTLVERLGGLSEHHVNKYL